jgi:tetratricopeptide (TPR) repeat protein
MVLSQLGQLLVERGQLPEARAHYDRALEKARQGGYRRLEGAVLGGIGGVLAREGRTREALDSVRAGETILREVLGREELGKLLCVRGGIEVALADRDRARAALDEAKSIAGAIGSVPSSELGRAIAALREALA